MRPRQLQTSRHQSAALVLRWLAALLAAAAVALCSGARGPHAGQLVASRAAGSPGAQPQAVMVGLLDGSLHSVDISSGEQQWSFDSGAPLLSSSATGSAGPAIFPGTDGTLYTNDGPGGQKGVQKLPLTVPELVEMSPSIAADNALLLGSKQTTVFVLDRRTGRLLKTFSSRDSSLLLDPDEDDHKSGLLETGIDWSRAMFVGRDDYVVRSVDILGNGKQLWNVTFSRLRCMDKNSLFTSPSRDGMPGEFPSGYLAAGPDGALRRFDPETGLEMWAIQLPNHPLAAFIDGSGHNLLQRQSPERAAVAEGGWGTTRSQRALLPGAAGRDGREEKSQVVLGQLTGGTVYVLPVDSTSLLEPSSGSKRPARQTQALPDGSSGEVILVSEGESADPMMQGMTCPSMGLQELVEGECLGFDFMPKSLELPGRPTALPRDRLAPPANLLPASRAASTGLQLLLALLFFALAAWYITGNRARQRTEPARALGAVPQPPGTLPEQPNQAKKKKRAKVKSKGSVHEDGEGLSDQQLQGSKELESREDLAGVDAPGPDGLSRGPSPGSGSNVSSSSGAGAGPLVRERIEEADGFFTIGRMRIDSNQVLGYGSAGTVVYAGELDGRTVAVKRLLHQFYDLARKELETLVRSDDHPNIVRCFALEEDREFVYLALELCTSNLSELVEARAVPLVDAAGEPTPLCMRVALQIVSGIETLHQRSIVHRDLKPANVLLTEGLCAKVSDMGLCKRLMADTSSFESLGPGGSSGWQAPEQLRQLMSDDTGQACRQTKALDIFSLGCVLFYCFTGGRHPYGDERFARDGNIVRGKANLSPLGHLPLLRHLVERMLSMDPDDRPGISAVVAHPAWWPPERQLSFLIDLSDRVEQEDRELLPADRELLNSLEATARTAIDGTGDWADLLDQLLLDNLGRFRRYGTRSLRDLLRVIRNKNNHFREMPPELQELMGPQPDGFLSYFTSRCPQLLLTTWLWTLQNCATDPPLDKYFPEGSSSCHWGLKPQPPRLPVTSACAPAAGATDPSPTRPAGAIARLPGRAEASPGTLPKSAAREPSRRTAARRDPDGKAAGPSSTREHQLPLPPPPVVYPRRDGELLCAFYERTGECKFGETCRFNHPPFGEIGVAHPVRPGRKACDFFLKTGGCVYGANCMFDHPPERAVARDPDGLPLRPGQPLCPQMAHYGRCTQGWFCKFDHSQAQLGPGDA